MNYIVDMQVLRLYAKQERITLTEVSSMLDMSNNSVSRYVTSSRNPDLNALIHICNTLRVSIESFIHHQDVQPNHVQVYPPDQFKPISFRHDAMEKYRQKKGMNQTTLLQNIRNHCEISADPSTYKRLYEKKRAGLEIPIGFLNTYNLPLSFLFDDPQLSSTGKGCTNTATIESLRMRVDELNKENQRLLAQNRRLISENRRLKTELTLPLANQGMPESHVEIARVVRKAIHALSELEGYFQCVDECMMNDK